MKLEKRIKDIEQRNKRVELDKTFETSKTRKICIMILTYIVVVIYSYLIITSLFLNYLITIDRVYAKDDNNQ